MNEIITSNNRIYRPSIGEDSLRQGEIFTDLYQYHLDIGSVGLDPSQSIIINREHPYAILITQDCDLDQDFRVRKTSDVSVTEDGRTGIDKLLPNLLFVEVVTSNDLIKDLDKRMKDRIKINNDARYHFLQKIEPHDDLLGEGLPELGMDFKRIFSIPTDEVYRRIEIGECKRRSVPISPYLEHLSQRFSAFIGRVGLPEQHRSE